ncbi:hypothetical protein P879_04078 [Paragonimus westermani]|uniref:Bridge-like lipid transfer protein family member 1 C-terminal domain-containing protein n=1 Tax=Paragonimus westermani TaxID=34504 RepID=A0A8T0D2S2_9TREM|nr:hypothetical protein P879_04078 [Paragonimus westermani]
MVYKSEFAKWKEYMNYLASLSPASPMANVRQGVTDHLFLPASTSLAKPHFRVDPHLATSCAANVSTLNDSSPLPAYPTAPFSTDSSQGIIRLKTLPEGALPTKLFLQLNVEDLGVCLPITVVQPNPQPMGVDSRTALVLTLDRSQISACYRDSFVGQGEFTDFCLRFDDDFNVGSDDWKPDWKRASVDVQSKHYSLILNACVVPSGTFNVCSHDSDKCAQWNLLVQWQMRGLDFHLDDNIGRRLKSLISVLTRITGYDGAAPLLPTSAEEEEEGEYVEGSHVQRELSGLAETDNVSAKDESLGKQIRNANRTSISIVGTQQSVVTHEPSRKHGGYSDIASLDRYRPGGCPPESVANMLPFDLSQVRSMELHKHQQELIEAQCCLAFKRQKWDTLRRKKGITMQRSPVFLHDPIKPPGAIAYSNIESQGLMNDRIPRSSIVADFSSSSVSNSDVHGPNVHRASIVSKDESVYFDTGSCEVTTQQVSEASENGRNNPFSCHLTNDHYSNQDLWFDPQEAVSFSEAGFPFSGSNFLTTAEEQGEGEPSEYSSSDEAEEHNGVKLASRPHRPLHDKSRVLFGDLSNGIRDIGTQPKVLLQVNVQIHIDSGCCVLHPRLPQDVLSTSVDLYSPIHPNVVPAQYRFQTPNTVASRPQTELGGRFSNSDLLGAYLERYKKHLLQDTQFLSTDLSVFLLPAVDVGLHYNSVTEVDFQTSPIPTSPSVPPTSPQATSTTVSGASLLPNQPTIVHSTSLNLGSLHTDTHGTLDGKQPVNTTIRESKVSTTNSHEFNVGHTSAMGNSGLKKQTDLFVSFFLQKLPKELIVHPALLDFLEQALESIPLLADWEVESASISSDGVQVEDKRNNASASHSAPLDTRFWETFPVHTVVHLHVQPLTVRFLCLPTSRMQCLMSLPFLDVIFSTNRSEIDGDADSSPAQNETHDGMLATSGENRDSSATRPTSSSTGDIVAEGGLCVTAILKEFRISIFHPYVDSKAVRSEPIWEATWSGDSLNLLVQDIRLNISRVVQTSLVLLPGDNPNSKIAGSNLDHSNLHACNQWDRALQPPAPEASFSDRSRNTFTNLVLPLSSWGLHRDVRFSGIFDIGVARFTCDTRRTLEILDIPNAWYRSSLARRLFIGNNEVTAEKCNKSTEVVDETLEPEVFSTQPADTSLQKAEHPTAINVDRCPPARPRCFSLATSSVAHWPPEMPNSDKSYKPKRRSTVAKPRWSRDALEPTANNFLSVKSCKKVTSASIPEQKSGGGNDIPTPGNLPSLSTTLMMERGTAAAATPNSSMRVASWHALPIFCVHLKRFELNLFIGSAMGQTRLTMDELFFDGRISLHSSGRKNTILSTGLGTCQFLSEGGGVGGEICLLNADAKVCLDEDPTHDPLHSLDARIGGFQLRIEYMNTNILLMRVSSLTLRLRDEWKLKDTARFIFERSQTAAVLTSTQLARSSLTNATTTGGCSSTPLEPQILESEVGAPPVYIRVVGEINWDQAQTAVVRTTTPDLIRSTRKVRDYFEEQVREGRMSLIGQTGSFGLLASRNSSVFRPMVSAQSGCARSQNAVVERTIIDKLLQRHWQHLLCESYNVYVREQLTVNPNFQPLSNPLSDMDDQLFPVLGGSLQLTGRSLGIACFAGSFRSAPDWAVFNIQYPTACFETEAQREAHASSLISSDPSESDGWINVRQVLSFDLGSQPEFRPQMAYVLRVRRGSQPNTRNPPTLTIAEWMEFTFRGADNTVVNFVRANDPESVFAVVQLAQFPIQFPDSAAGVATVIDDQTHTFGVVRETGTSDTTSVSTYSLRQSLRNPSINTSKREHPSSSVAASMSNTLRNNLHPIITAQPSALPRPHPLRPPVEGEILFILPSISLRITTDQRQTMAQPTLCSLSSVLPKHSAESASSRSTTVTSGARSWIYGRKTVPSSLPQGDSGNPVVHSSETTVTLTPDEAVPGFAPTVKISFQTDFHGFVQLGLIDVPWLPSLINSYLNERLHDYELLTAAPPCSSQFPGLIDSGPVSSSGTMSDNLTTRLRELATTSSPMVQDARIYEIVHWSLSPMCRWLLASNIGVPAFDRLLENIGFRKARVTIPKWLQRGVMDNLDSVMATLIRASMQLTIKKTFAEIS